MDGEKFSFNTPLSPMRFQSQLGKEAKRMYKEGLNIVKLSLARVIKVNYKYNTVDVITTLHKNTTSKNPNDNGRFSARLPVAFGGRTPEGNVYGSNTLVTVGSLVLVGFLEGNKDHPIVLNIYGDADNQSQLTRTTLTSADESDEAIQKELWQLFTLYPSMTYHNIDGHGNQEITFSGKSFMYVTDSDQNNEYVQDGGFDYHDLPSSRYANGELIEPKSPNSPTLLYVHQGVYDKHRVTFFIKSDGTVRMGSRHLDGEGITFQEMNTDGSFKIVQQQDDTNPEGDSKVFSKFEITESGEFILQTPKHKFEITEDGVLIDGKHISAIGGGGGGIPVDLSELEKGLEDVNTTIEIINGKIETKVNKTDYNIDTQAIEDAAAQMKAEIQVKVDEVNQSLSALDTFLDSTFSDGNITSAEKSVLNSYINALSSDKSGLEFQYNDIYASVYLTETDKISLADTKSAFETRHTELMNTIEISIADDKVTSLEISAVDSAFSNYSTALASLSTMLLAKVDVITLAKIKEAAANPLDYLQGEVRHVGSTITQLADSISMKVESETFTSAIENLESTKASTEDITVVNERIDETNKAVEQVAAELPYKTEIFSTNGNIFRNGVISTILFCKVYRGTEEVTNTLPAESFIWSRVSDDFDGDQAWNAEHVGVGNSVEIDTDDVFKRATFNCDISIVDENNT
jgi:hypothetical protein